MDTNAAASEVALGNAGGIGDGGNLIKDKLNAHNAKTNKISKETKMLETKTGGACPAFDESVAAQTEGDDKGGTKHAEHEDIESFSSDAKPFIVSAPASGQPRNTSRYNLRTQPKGGGTAGAEDGT